MLHRLCGPPSIPLSFTLASVLPRRITYRVSFGTEVRPPTPSNHRLQLGLPGYLILFAPLALAPQRQYLSRELPSSSAFLQISTHSTATLVVPPSYPILYLDSFKGKAKVKPWSLTSGLNKQPTDALRPIIPDNACIPRITAAAGTELADAYSLGTVRASSLRKGVYNPWAVNPPRGIAPSGFRPLRKIPHCCLP